MREYRPEHYRFQREQSAYSKMCDWEVNGPWTGRALLPSPRKAVFFRATIIMTGIAAVIATLVAVNAP